MPVSAYTESQTYIIWFRDRNEYEFAVAAVGGNPTDGGLFYGNPQSAAAFFNIPYPFITGGQDNLLKNCWGTSNVTPYAGSPTLTDGIDSILVPPLASSFGPVGSYWTLEWVGAVIFFGPNASSSEVPIAIPQRRFIGGMELLAIGEGGVSSTFSQCRDSSRTLDGFGFAARGGNSTGSFTRNITEYAGGTTHSSWERLYLRPRISGTGIVGFWRCANSVSPSAGAVLAIKTNGQLSLYGRDSIGNLTLYADGPILDAFTWIRLDIFLKFPTIGADHGFIFVYLNGAELFVIDNNSGSGIDTVGNHAQSIVGKGAGFSNVGQGFTGTGDNQVEFDLDDWINAEWPLNAGFQLDLRNIDFLLGSHVRRNYTLSGTVIGWAPTAPQMLNQGLNPTIPTGAALVSTTSGALIEGLTDVPLADVESDILGEVVFGAVAAVVGTNSKNSAGTDGQIGYDANGVANMQTVNQTAANAYQSMMYRPTGLVVPDEISPFKVRHTKSVDANTDTTNFLQAAIEYIGIWGAEDSDLYPIDIPRINHLHNCRYANSPFGLIGPAPFANVFAVGGTYVGNGIEQDVNLPYPCHLLFIRATSGAVTKGVKFFGCSIGPHSGTTDQVNPNYGRVWMDSTGQVKFTIVGTDAEINAVGVTYQYIAFCDPGMRFCCTGAYNTPSNVASRNNTLQNPDFLPEFAFIQPELLGNASSTVKLTAKGPGNVGTTGNLMNGGASSANWGSFSNGILTTLADNHPSIDAQINYAVFRSSEPNCGWTMLQILSYTGDGIASRNIPLTPVSGRFPLFALICPTSGAQAPIFRDPSHAGANSARFDTLGNTATGITAGAMDQITVGISLNAAGVVYNVFIIPGDTAGWNNGTFNPPNCETPAGAWFAPVMLPPDIAVLGDGGVVLGEATSITLLVNVSGLYTLVSGKTNDTVYNRVSGASTEVRAIPSPSGKTGFISG